MNNLPVGPEIITLAGVRERMAAYEEECKRKEKLTKITVFQVEDGTKIGEEAFHSIQGSFNRSGDGLDGMSGHEGHETGAHHHALGPEKYSSDNDDHDKSVGADDLDLDLEPDEHDPDDSAYFNYSARPSFFRGASFDDSDSEKEAPKQPVEKTPEQLAMDAKEEEAKTTFTILLEKEKNHAHAPVILQSFSSLQKRYLSAVAELRPAEEDSTTPSSGTAPSFNKQKIKAELRKEANRKERFSTLKSSYYAYAEAAQDKREEVEDICVEEEIENLEDAVVEEWVDFAEKAVEKVEILVAAKESGDETEAAASSEGGDDDDDLAEMEKWREEAKKLKEEANERKQRKAEQEAFRAERKEKAKQQAKERAMYLEKKKERAAAKKKAQEEAAAKKAQEDEAEKEAEAETETDAAAEAELEAEHEAELAEAAEEAKKKSGDGAAEAEEHKKKADHHDAKKKADHEKKKSEHGKKKKKEEKSKDEKKKKDKKKKGDEDGEKKGDDEVDKKKGEEESDGDDAPDEKFPRNLDGSIWKNVLKFWTNKPKSLKEKSSKVTITTTPGSDCFRPSATSGNDNASFYWHKVEGDFDCVVHIKGEFTKSYDKAGIMLRVDEKTWMMSGVEYFGEQLNHASCITREISDWSLAPLPAEAKKGCWFCVKRVGNKVESFYSMDTKNWIQTRQGLFTDTPTIKVGIATGSPTGEGFKVTFDRFWMRKN